MLCGYRHNISETSNDRDELNVDIETDTDDPEDEINKGIIESDEFSSDEYQESVEMLCDQYCDMTYGYHLHYDNLYSQYFGVDTRNIRERIIPMTKEHSFAYPCNMCEIYSKNLDDHQEHIKRIHGDVERALKCVIENCEYKSQHPEKLTRHIAVKHNEFIKNRMEEWQQ